MSWYLQKCGYEPKSAFIDSGSKKHVELGRAIDKYEVNVKKSNKLKFVGYFLLFLAVIILLIEVVL
jgi:hypothetical protein